MQNLRNSLWLFVLIINICDIWSGMNIGSPSESLPVISALADLLPLSSFFDGPRQSTAAGELLCLLPTASFDLAIS